MKILFRIFLVLSVLVMAAVLFFAIVFRDRRPRIYFASEEGDTNYIARYLDRGNDVNGAVTYYRFGHRRAPLLSVAVASGRLDTVNFLINRGANPNQLDTNGDPPLIWAIGGSGNEVSIETRIRILKVLLESGADPNLKASSNYHYSPLQTAASLGQSEMVSILLSHGANVNETNIVGQTALHLADNEKVARLLIDAGGDIGITTQWGETPVESAARWQKYDVLSVLTNAGANATHLP